MVNLACKAVIAAMSNLDFVGPDDDDAILFGTNLQGINRDLLDAIRAIVRVVSPLQLCVHVPPHVYQIRYSSLRRHQFAEVLRSLSLAVLQLLRDVDTRWSALLLMIARALQLKRVSMLVVTTISSGC
jgi:hypothetical protein